MERGVCIIPVVVLIFQEAVGFSIRNEQLGRCMQALGGRLVLEECRPDSGPQQWEWRPHTQALVSVQAGECLSALQPQEHESVRLQPCGAGGGEGGGEGQAWGCSKKGHLTLSGTKGLHLSAHQDGAKVLLSQERGRGSKWRTLGNRTVCNEPGGPHHWHRHGDKPTPTPAADTSSAGANAGPRQNVVAAPNPTESGPEKKLRSLPYSTRDPGPDPGPSTTPFFSQEYGLGWEVAMLVLTSLALVIGLLVLVLSIYYNRKKKVMCVVKSYTPTGEASLQGSPVPNERAPLTRHPMKPPRSPSLQRGEILIEWKDGTVTPLFDTHTYLAD